MKETKTMIKIKGRAGLTLVVALTIVFSLVMFSQTSSAALTFSGRDCNGNQICDVVTRCDANACSSSFENCQSCGTATKTCPSGPIFVPRVCDIATKQCRDGTATCPSGPPSGVAADEPFTVLRFQVFTKKNLLITVTPESQTGLAGSTLNYKISFENKNPKSLLFKTSADIPQNWQVNIPAEVTLGENSKKEVSFRVTSNETAADASYPILIGVFNSELNLFGPASASYIVASRGAPTLLTTPKSQAGYPGASLMYNVSVTNNDPADFDASTISMRAESPAGFNAVFTPSSIKLKPKETGYVRLDVTSPSNATEAAYAITINATANKLSASEFIEYQIDFCGNTVCEAGEDDSCRRDCPDEPNFACSGRCEQELDDGLAFSASVSVPFNRFIVCSRNSTLQNCLQSARTAATANSTSCGIGRTCLCVQVHDAPSASVGSCNARCVDAKGVYYLLANGTTNVRSTANYSFACPFVDLPEIIDLRDNFSAAKQDYEKAQSALRETLKTNTTAAKRAESQPCVDALTSIIISTADFVRYLNDVIAWPGKLNTTAARGRAPLVRSNVESIYNTFCRGASGLLQIDSVAAGPVEKGQTGRLDVTVKNIGNIRYSGYVQCDITGATGEKAAANSSCTIIGALETFQLPFNASSAGQWRANCKTFGLLNDCLNASLHHELTAQFNVTTRDTFVVDVTGNCGLQLNCSVRTSQFGCGACSANGQLCNRIANMNGTEIFDCPRAAYGNYTLVGFVQKQTNNRCRPIPPTEKNITVRCAGCGDGVIDNGEQCEPAFTNDNQRCSQTQSTCEGRLYGIRDRVGFCTASCGCSYDQFEFSCTRGQCSAECEDKETRIVTINTTTGSCQCTQQCGSSCSWNPCSCETGAVGVPVTATGVPSVTVSHSPPAGNQVTLTATGTNLTRIEIYVDGFVVRTCDSLQCTLTASYASGTHSYFARAVNLQSAVTDPTSGTKSFTISAGLITVNVTQPGLNVTSVIVDVSHSPQAPTTDDFVVLTAVAHGPRSFKQINIFVDDALKKTCQDYAPSQPCTFRATYSEGTHTYFATAADVRNVSGTTESKDFSVTKAASPEQPVTPIIGVTPVAGTPSTPARARCYAKIESKNCTYNEKTRRYDVSLAAIWDNGTHAHADVDNDPAAKIYPKNFTVTRPLSAPGLKNVKVVVHDVNDSTICFDSGDIYCGPGSSTGKDVDIIFDVKEVVKTGLTDVRVIFVPYSDASARLQSYTDAAANVSAVRIEGNTTPAGLSGPVRVAENKSYLVYTVTTGFSAKINISILYRLRLDTAGEYKLLATANYSGKFIQAAKTIKATSCPQAYSVLGKGPSGACVEFATPCDMPPGWVEVASCPDEEIIPEKEESPLMLVILIVILVVLAALAYRYRDRLREKLHRERKEKKYAEELPSFEE